MKCECFRRKDVKELARKLFFMRTGHERVFGCDWFRRFLFRHNDLIGNIKAISVDDDRASLSLKSINEYIEAVLNALKLVTDLRLVLNMDKNSFGKRPEYKK